MPIAGAKSDNTRRVLHVLKALFQIGEPFAGSLRSAKATISTSGALYLVFRKHEIHVPMPASEIVTLR